MPDASPLRPAPPAVANPAMQPSVPAPVDTARHHRPRVAPLQSPALLIGGAYLPFRHLAGLEAFPIELTAVHPYGARIIAYGIKTAHERSIHKLAIPFDVGREPVRCEITLAPFAAVPEAGDVPFELWLIDADGRPSNLVRAGVVVQ